MDFKGELGDSDNYESQSSSTEDNDDAFSGNNISTSHLTSLCVPTSDAKFYSTSLALANHAFSYKIAPWSPKINFPLDEEEAQYFVLDKYSQALFQGVFPNTEAANNSIGGFTQFLALQKKASIFKNW